MNLKDKLLKALRDRKPLKLTARWTFEEDQQLIAFYHLDGAGTIAARRFARRFARSRLARKLKKYYKKVVIRG